jgi:hypothetical protein
LRKSLDNLNIQLYNQLNKLGVGYTAPQCVGKEHVFHVAYRVSDRLEINEDYASKAVYLIEVTTIKELFGNNKSSEARLK